MFRKNSFEKKLISPAPQKLKLGIGLKKQMKKVLNVKLNSEVALALRQREKGDQVETKDFIIEVESVKHSSNVK